MAPSCSPSTRRWQTCRAEDFVRRIWSSAFAVAGAAIALNFHFGANRAGSPDFPRRGRQTARLCRRRRAAATRSRPPGLLAAIREALGRRTPRRGPRNYSAIPWFLSGTVIHGDKRGRELGFPTANLKARSDMRTSPRHLCRARRRLAGRRHDGRGELRPRPMFDAGTGPPGNLLFDFSGDLYGADMDVRLYRLPRDEAKFASAEELIRQMRRTRGSRVKFWAVRLYVPADLRFAAGCRSR